MKRQPRIAISGGSAGVMQIFTPRDSSFYRVNFLCLSLRFGQLQRVQLPFLLKTLHLHHHGELIHFRRRVGASKVNWRDALGKNWV